MTEQLYFQGYFLHCLSAVLFLWKQVHGQVRLPDLETFSSTRSRVSTSWWSAELFASSMETTSFPSTLLTVFALTRTKQMMKIDTTETKLFMMKYWWSSVDRRESLSEICLLFLGPRRIEFCTALISFIAKTVLVKCYLIIVLAPAREKWCRFHDNTPKAVVILA